MVDNNKQKKESASAVDKKAKKKLFNKNNIIRLILIFFTLLILIFGILFKKTFAKLNSFAKGAEMSIVELQQIVKNGTGKEPININGYKNILILGTDSLENRGDVPPLTDTMMLVSINLSNAKITTLPLPRDLWSEDYQTRINALLAYGYERYPENPKKFPTEVISEMSELQIHHTIIISMEQVSEIINLLGGVEVDIPESFTDDEFPRADVDITVVDDPELLYESVSFVKGKELMTGDRALKYIRSRHSGDDQGNDVARSKRQQQVLLSLIHELLNIEKRINQPYVSGQILRFYIDNFDKHLDIEELISTGYKLYPQISNVKFVQSGITILDEDNPDGIISHPNPSLYNNQWIYIIEDDKEFKKYIKRTLNP